MYIYRKSNCIISLIFVPDYNELYWQRAGRSEVRIPVEARFSALVQTGPGDHPASCKWVPGLLSGVRSGRCVTLTPRPLLMPWSRKSRAIPLLPLWAVRPVQSLSACTREHFTLPFYNELYSFLVKCY